ncbi:phage tail sheath subtilisin-like domain-containing protein [Paenibacillus planticolens]|uniref:Phage tail sheath protein n=1 Tax=Paenibacillus planticolens TaxID=2654976 RepID=A0ABX1ZEE8_9BACL|nr:phage tail sheath subtilisin-like domain-containing protein [Paenibacillus planticolens]NOU98483.1 phage tail sheath protein [Paenibacillus planticolens]
MSGGSWDPTSLPVRPGLYLNFKSAAVAQISGGARGTVAIPLKAFAGGSATVKTFYTVTNETDAAALFGAANIVSIKYALQGGAKEVLVYTLPPSATATDYADARTAFDTRPFNVHVFDGEVAAAIQDSMLTWVAANRTAGKHFLAVFGAAAAADDQTPATGNARSVRLLDNYAVNLTVGAIINGTAVSSGVYAPYLAGLIAGTPINRSITYKVPPVSDVNKRYTNSEVVAALAAGSVVLVNDGEKVRVEQGLTTSVKKIRSMRARQAISNDITKTAADSYIGQINNDADGQAALISAVKAYLETLEGSGVLSDISVGLDPQYKSVGDSVYLLISYVELDSMERIFLTISV